MKKVKKAQYAVVAVYVRLAQIEAGKNEDVYEIASQVLFDHAPRELSRLVSRGALQFSNWHVQKVSSK